MGHPTTVLYPPGVAPSPGGSTTKLNEITVKIQEAILNAMPVEDRDKVKRDEDGDLSIIYAIEFNEGIRTGGSLSAIARVTVGAHILGVGII